MGRWQKTYLKYLKSETNTSTSGTITLDLPEKDYISQLLIIPYHLNTAYSASPIPSFLAIKKIEVLDGSEVIKSLSGRQVQALAYYWGRTNPCPRRQDWENTETKDYFYLRFGRYAEDFKYMLNMAMTVNPQLKITYDFDTVSYDGITYTCPTAATKPTFKWSVFADIYRGTPPETVEGFIRSQQIEDWTLSTGTTTKYVDIPRTERIAGIMLQGGYVGKMLLAAFNRIRLNLNTGTEIPIDVYKHEIAALQEEWFTPPPRVDASIDTKTNVKFDSGLGMVESLAAIQKGLHAYHGPSVVSHDTGYIDPIYVTVLDTPDADAQVSTLWKFQGLFPHHTIYLPMQKLTADGAFTLDAASYAKIILELTSLNADTTVPKNCVLETIGH